MTDQKLQNFTKLVGRMHKAQQLYYRGNKSEMVKAMMLEKRVDAELANYNFNEAIAQVWERRFIGMVSEVRAAQKKYYRNKTNLDKLRARDEERRLDESIKWLVENYPQGVEIESLQSVLYDRGE